MNREPVAVSVSGSGVRIWLQTGEVRTLTLAEARDLALLLAELVS